MADFLKRTAFHLNYRWKNKGERYSNYREALSKQYLPISELKKIQLCRLKHIISYAYENVPFYNELYNKAHVSPNILKTLDDIRKFPFTDKELMKKKDIDRRIAKGIDVSRMNECRTGGSTSVPFLLYSDRLCFPEEHSAFLRELDVMDYRLGDKILHIRAYPACPGKLSCFIGRDLYIDSAVVEIDPKVAVDLLFKEKPDFIEGYPASLIEIARYMSKNGLKYKCKGMQPIGFAMHKKDLIEKVFDCHILQDYGAAEFMRIAYQCTEMNYHCDISRHVIEVMDGERICAPGEEGEIVVTNLTNEVMPFIRYRLHDRAIIGKSCSCGRTFPILSKILGKSAYDIRMPSGKLIRGGRFLGFFDDFIEFIDRGQVVKIDDTHYDVLIVKGKSYDEKSKNMLDLELKKRLGDEIVFNIKTVKDIKLASSGKEILLRGPQ